MQLKKILLGAALAWFASFVNASDGLKTVTSQHDVSETTNRLENIVVDHLLVLLFRSCVLFSTIEYALRLQHCRLTVAGIPARPTDADSLLL